MFLAPYLLPVGRCPTLNATRPLVLDGDKRFFPPATSPPREGLGEAFLTPYLSLLTSAYSLPNSFNDVDKVNR